MREASGWKTWFTDYRINLVLKFYCFIQQQVWCWLWRGGRTAVSSGFWWAPLHFTNIIVKRGLLREQPCSGVLWQPLDNIYQFPYRYLHSGAERRYCCTRLLAPLSCGNPPTPPPTVLNMESEANHQVSQREQHSFISSKGVSLTTHFDAQTPTFSHTHTHALQVCHKLSTWVTV